MPISCVYCGSDHDRPADVRACWARHQDPEGSAESATDADADAVAPVATGISNTSITQVDQAAHPGPDELGRNLVTSVGTDVPAAWAHAATETVTTAHLDDPWPLVERCRARATTRDRTVFFVSPEVLASLSSHEVVVTALAELGPRYELPREALGHAVLSNSVVVTEGSARWPLTAAALALGAQPAPADVNGDVVLPNGTPAWLDGGPLRFSGPLLGACVVPALAVHHGRLSPFGSNEVPASATSLAPDQHAAVTHPGGSARIIAPAGSGKTRVLTERARHLLTGWGLPAPGVCLVAFNTRAQAEMRERTADLPALTVRTLNSLALAVVNGTRPFLPVGPSRQTIDEGTIRQLLGDLVAVPKRRNTDPLAPWIDALSMARLGLVDPVEVEVRYDGDVSGFPEVFDAYRRRLTERSLLDFDEQIVAAIDVLLRRPDARSAAQRACSVLLVDEFQDLAPAHLLLIRLLAGPSLQVFGVGDDDQTIYGYQGADPAWLIDYATLFPGAGDHPLEVNYRCPASIVEAATHLLARNTRRVPKQIRSGATAPGGWRVIPAADTLAATVLEVDAALAAGASPGDIAVLTRVNALAAPVQAALSERVPVRGGVGREFCQRTAVRATLAWLRLATGTWRREDLNEALRRPSRPLPERVTTWVTETKDLPGLERLAARLRTPREAERVEGFAADIARLRAAVARGADTAELLQLLTIDVGLAGAVSTLDLNRRGMNRGAQADDLVALDQLATLQTDPAAFPAWLEQTLGGSHQPAPGAEAVTLATVHRVKGQEWPVVIVHEAAAGQFPHRLAEDVEEERRLFHVALTRASRECVVVGPADSPSPFIRELDSDPSSDPAPAPPVSRSSGTGPGNGRAPSGPPPGATSLRDKSRLVVVVGTVLVDQGVEWVVESVTPVGAVARCGPASRAFPLGTRVSTVGGATAPLAVPTTDDPDPAAVLIFDALRALRRRLAAGKPAYTVFDDATMERLALARPRSTDELARIQGIGPAKLEQFGSDIIALIEQVIDESAPS